LRLPPFLLQQQQLSLLLFDALVTIGMKPA
jgi:hypothetical protein